MIVSIMSARESLSQSQVFLLPKDWRQVQAKQWTATILLQLGISLNAKTEDAAIVLRIKTPVERTRTAALKTVKLELASQRWAAVPTGADRADERRENGRAVATETDLPVGKEAGRIDESPNRPE
jgi:hypothetical protein